ncbi:uncharacterized protein LOC107759198 isoform X2 [Nicotiana tabacum]|uniref:Uncharacterized protein LOC107759198 isoform X2 n=3 Tax=Nicotiana TaxID=4085 RepID=A0AC58RQI7_TOBAC|nr:PREDICTED: uncharacterized protein LOC104213062 isoform X1 [Nicotiana sylvestris]XP_009760779.1 PREDICTED: uncharacterized protein LOC104213062 isoform X1 [Nicotiana sylvestris]XP_009760787.1 PREDICTED: uncharacterized protein LOC104213062 isoform X1 [Nicotiana sylvestris]
MLLSFPPFDKGNPLCTYEKGSMSAMPNEQNDTIEIMITKGRARNNKTAMNIELRSDYVPLKKVFSPNYTLPPARSNPDVMAIDIRQAWGPGMDIINPHFLAFAAAERQFLQSEYDDYAIASSGSLACFRYVAIILMLLLLIRQTLMATRDFSMVQDSSIFFNFQISLLQLVAFLLPYYVMARTWYMIQCRRRRQAC